jgi:PGF-CTERM protein
MVVAMLLVAALVVAPVAARTVSTGNTIYVGEEALDVSAIIGAPSGTLVRFSSYADRTVETTIPVYDSAQFDLTADSVGTRTGQWYGFPSGANYGDKTVTETGTVDIQIPSANIDVLLTGTSTSVNGKSVTRGQPVDFRISHNLGGFPGALMDVRVTTPGGGTVTEINGVDLKGQVLTGQSRNTISNVPMTGLTTGTYTARGIFDKPAGSSVTGTGFDTANTVTFEVTSGALSIVSNKDNIVRGNTFTVTITGESEKLYNVTVQGTDANRPMVVSSQVGVTNNTGFAATVKTTASGTRSVELNTSSLTEAKTYTIKVEGPIDSLDPKDDEVKVKVEKGSVTITTSGTGTYYIGEEITLSGTCTGSDANEVYLFMTGPNFAANGVNLTSLGDVVNTVAATFDTAPIEADDTWSKKWNTGDLIKAGKSIDAGSYTIYAASLPRDKSKISDAEYSSATISLRSGFLSATTSSATVAKGDKLTISGTAQGNPDEVFIWIFGKNYYGAPSALKVQSATVESDGAFEYELKSADTKDLASGQYFVVVQHPMGSTTGNRGSITVNEVAGTILTAGMTPVTLTGLQAPNAATALINALDSPNIPDTYVKLTFVIDEPQLFIDPIGDKAAGSTFTISGTTNLAAGNTLNIDVTSAAFQPGQKTEASAFSGTGGSTVIQKGDGMNTWSFEVDGSSFKVDQYIVTVESIDAGQTATTIFNVVEAVPTTQPSGNVTTPTGTETTPTGTETTEPTPTIAPGFGAILALAGLGAVAFLVLRRN